MVDITISRLLKYNRRFKSATIAKRDETFISQSSGWEFKARFRTVKCFWRRDFTAFSLLVAAPVIEMYYAGGTGNP